MVTMQNFEPLKYSGELSEEFWEKVNNIPWGRGGEVIYVMGCALQDLEGRVITLLNNALDKRKSVRPRRKL